MAWHDIKGRLFEEKMMWLNVMRRSIFDYVLYKGKKKHELVWRKANRFIFGPQEDHGDRLNFDQICGLFNYNPDYIRRQVKGLQRTDIRRLEAMKFKDEFKQDNAEPSMVTPGRFETTESTVPPFSHHMYSRDFWSEVKPRKVPMELPRAPIVQWSIAAA
jgi:hypothetical protein